MNDTRSTAEIEKYAQELVQAHGGSVTTKKIRGVERFYLQWRENGVQKSKYLKPREVEAVRRFTSSYKADVLSGKVASEVAFETNVFLGGNLRRLSESVVGWQERDDFPLILEFVRGSKADRVLLVYGLRRTGKTTMLRQVILNLSEDELSRTAYIKINSGDSIGALDRDLKRLRERGVNIVLVDEATLLENFIDCASMFSDIHAALGMKIVFSGTDSLGFWFAAHNELYDRELTVHTTFIPFREHVRLLGTDDIDTYIEYGGTLKVGDRRLDHADARREEASFRDDESARFYVDTAIARNIQRSLRCFRRGGEFRHLQALEDAGELTNAINRIVEDLNHRFVLRVLTEDFRSHDLGSASDLLMKAKDPDRQMDLRAAVDVEQVTGKLMEILDIRNRESCRAEVSEDAVREIHTYLRALDLVAEVDERIVGESPLKRTIFIQPGLRYAQAQALVFSLRADLGFRALTQDRADAVVDCILQDVRGRMLEDLVVYETRRALVRHGSALADDVFKLKFEDGEFDMVVRDGSRRSCRLFEIKHSTERNDLQTRHLTDERKLAETERLYGSVVERTVLYRGDDADVGNGVRYRNVGSFLMSIASE